MKKFLLFLVIAISAVSMGLTIYYFSADNEVIYIKTSYIVCEVNETISTDKLVGFKYKDDNTKLTFGVSGGGDVLDFKAGDEYYVAKKGGSADIIITTTNKSYPTLVISVLVCDGSKDYPYIISSEEQLSSIGKADSNYKLNNYYNLGADINFAEGSQANWTPIADFAGVFNGKFHKISNLNIGEASLSAQTQAGLFANITADGLVKNLTLENAVINTSTAENIGMVAGVNEGHIEAVQVTGDIISSRTGNSFVGGIVGVNNGGKVDRCSYVGGFDFTNANQSLIGGGLVGHNKAGVVSECFYRAEDNKQLQNKNANFGGIVGKNEGVADKKANVFDSYFFMSTFNDNINESRIGGIIYKDFKGNDKNIILGNYYGGNIAKEFIKTTVENQSEISGKSNGYMETLSFRNRRSFINAVYVDESIRLWNFDSVWTMGDFYPIFDTSFVAGSIYPDDTSNILGKHDVVTAQELYDALCDNSLDASYSIIRSIDFSNETWIWGDESHPIPQEFKGTLTGGESIVLKNLTITNPSAYVPGQEEINVGLVQNLASSANIMRLNFENVTINGQSAKSVGVIAGKNKGGRIEDIQIKTVAFEIPAEAVGGIVGSNEYSQNGEDMAHAISGIKIQNLDATKFLAKYAGGIAGINRALITDFTLGQNYSVLTNINLYALKAGGAVGVNIKSIYAGESSVSGQIAYVDVQEFKFYQTSQRAVTEMAEKCDQTIQVGGIAGYSGNNAKISQVKAYATIKIATSEIYNAILGGIVGHNEGIIFKALAEYPTISTIGNYNSTVGGLVGLNGYRGTTDTGVAYISSSIVRRGSIDAGLKENIAGHNILDFSVSSIAGGLVGYDRFVNADTPSIEKCYSSMESINGRIVGGLVGLAKGSHISECGVGSEDGESGHAIKLNGVVVGGLTAINLDNTKIKNCYTFARLESVFDGEGSKASDMFKLNVSSLAGMSVVHLESAEIESCYSVASFSNKNSAFNFTTIGMKLFKGTTGKATNGKTSMLIYQNEQTNPFDNKFEVNHIRLTKEDFVRQNEFFSNIAENVTDARTIWGVYNSSYPELISIHKLVEEFALFA